MIEVKNLVKKYGYHMAVNNLSFTVDKGQILGFLGPNGAGKSTTMNIITGYISATEGTVVVGGHDIFEEPEEAKKCIGYLPELPPLYPDMTVREYLNFVADLKQVKKLEKTKMINKIMNMTKITSVSERLIKHLSKGYKQRVGLAQAIVGFPEVLILDEPTVGLDPMQIIEIRDLIRELKKNHTIILSSHILSEVSAVCDQIIIINKGKLIVSDTADNLSSHITGTNNLQLEVKGKKETVQNILKRISNIEKVKYGTSEQQGLVSFTISCNGNVDIREEIFYAFSDAKCPILSMQSTRKSLEDIFLEVTKDDKKVYNKLKENNEVKSILPQEKEEAEINPSQENKEVEINPSKEKEELKVNQSQENKEVLAYEVNKEDKEVEADASDL